MTAATITHQPLFTPSSIAVAAPVVSRGYAICKSYPTMQSVIVQAAVQFPIRTHQPCRYITVRDTTGLQAPQGVELVCLPTLARGVALASNERIAE